MTRLIFCQKLKEETEGLTRPTYPGELGQRIYQHISQHAWSLWLDHQTMLINEYRMNPLDPETRKRLESEMESFLFEEGGEKPAGYQPMDADDTPQ